MVVTSAARAALAGGRLGGMQCEPTSSSSFYAWAALSRQDAPRRAPNPPPSTERMPRAGKGVVVQRLWIATGRGSRSRKGRRDAHSARRNPAERRHSEGERSSRGMLGCTSADDDWGRNKTAASRSQAARVSVTTGRCVRLSRYRTSSASRTPGRPRTSACGRAQHEERGHRARGSKRGR